MGRLIAAALILCVILSGCRDVFDGHYSSAVPHQAAGGEQIGHRASAKDRQELYDVLAKMVSDGEEEALISVADYDPELLSDEMWEVRSQLEDQHPIGAYAVDWISFKEGKSEGERTLTVHIRYIHDRTEIRAIRSVEGMEELERKICQAVERYDVGLVLCVQGFESRDLVQVVRSFADENIHQIMEVPQVTVATYPEKGDVRVVELRFTYQTDRDTLRSMREQVEPVFQAANKAARGQEDGYRALFDFLIGGYELHITASITPAYSLLKYGVGDSRAFAQVYDVMCRQAGLECMVVSGTKDGASHYWNIVRQDGAYYHLDLLGGEYRLLTDQELVGYVWDYAAYPDCDAVG